MVYIYVLDLIYRDCGWGKYIIEFKFLKVAPFEIIILA